MLSFWAKSGVPTFHSVPHHSFDVAAVCLVLLEKIRVPLSLSPQSLVALVALHDIGKFTRPFQSKAPDLWPECLGAFAPAPTGWPHDKADYALLKSEKIWPQLTALFPAGSQSW
jgi:CRISPR-associated endonuclease/helicase Cas3